MFASRALSGLVIVMVAGFGTTALAQQTPLQRGTYLVQTIAACGNCHTPKGERGDIPGMEMAGGFKIEAPPFTAVVPNITPDPETGIGKWTDEQIIVAIREGKRPDGSIIGPPMPIELYRDISDGDARAMVAYLRRLKPIRNKVEKSVYRMPLPPNYGPPLASVPEPKRGDKVAYGGYLANALGHCTECHTPMLADGRRDFANQMGAGGPPVEGPLGMVVPPNLTPDGATGLGTWTDAEIKRAITKAVSKDGRKLAPPMAFPYYAKMSNNDLDAIVAYLRSLKPVHRPKGS